MSGRKGFLAGLLLAVFTAIPAQAADVRRTIPERRPYIVEVGEPYGISRATIEDQADGNSALREYLAMYGYPDYAEVQEIEPLWPWESYEIRLFYLRRDLEIAFNKVPISRALENYGVMRFRGYIDPQKRHEIEVILAAREAPPLPPPVVAAAPAAPEPMSMEASLARLEAAAERAALAADRAVAASEAAAQSADRATAAFERVQRIVERGTR